jgi:hypothetical protein
LVCGLRRCTREILSDVRLARRSESKIGTASGDPSILAKTGSQRRGGGPRATEGKAKRGAALNDSLGAKTMSEALRSRSPGAADASVTQAQAAAAQTARQQA